MTTVLVRYDKTGRQVPDTGHGCGCGLCQNTGAPRYERRRRGERTPERWSRWRRALVRMARSLAVTSPIETA